VGGDVIDGERLRAALWRGARARLREALEAVADRPGEAVYVVGGLPRAIVLGGDTRDVDLVVEGDGIGLARALGAELGVPVRVAERFLAAELDAASLGLGRVDVGTARRESYPAPGALPVVEPAPIGDDLARRDFTVNTLALGVAGAAPRELLCHPAALDDLSARRVRVLHERSFLDDPTRLPRAVDLELAIGGAMEPGTERLARQAIARGALGWVSGERLWAAMTISLGGPGGARPLLERWRDLGLDAELLPGGRSLAERDLDRVAETVALLARLEAALAARGGEPGEEPGEESEGKSEGESAAAAGGEPGGSPVRRRPAALLLALGLEAPASARRAWIERFAPPRRVRSALLDAGSRLERAIAALRENGGRASEDHAALGDLEAEELAVVGAVVGPGGRERVIREVESSRSVALRIGARDLLARGARPGPAIGRALDGTLAARLDGVIGAEDELDFALGRLGEEDREPAR
jgi:tRNA nucleotidyltransferase (CCA-adding enzyme)